MIMTNLKICVIFFNLLSLSQRIRLKSDQKWTNINKSRTKHEDTALKSRVFTRKLHLSATVVLPFNRHSIIKLIRRTMRGSFPSPIGVPFNTKMNH